MIKFLSLLFFLVSNNIFSILEIEILKGSDNLSKVAFVPFGVKSTALKKIMEDKYLNLLKEICFCLVNLKI